MSSPIWRDAWWGIHRHPLRSVLLVLILGLSYGEVLIFIGTVEGGRDAIRQSLNSLGVDVIAALNPIQVEGVPFLKIGKAGDRLIDDPAIEELAGVFEGEGIELIPMHLGMTRLSADSGASSTNTLMSVSPGFAQVLKTGLVAGRFLEVTDVYRAGDTVNCVLDEALARIFEPEDPGRAVGQTFLGRRGVESFHAHVVGVMRDPLVLRKHLDAFDSLKRARELTAKRLEFLNLYVLYDPERDDPSGVLVKVPDVADVDPTCERLDAFFSDRGIAPFYHVQKDWIDGVLRVVDDFSLLAHFLWIASLLAVLAVTSTVALMSVEERFRDLAIRRVEGATVAQVVWPLMIEGAALALASSPVGYLVAYGIAAPYLKPILEWPLVVSPFARWGTLLLLALVGVLTYALPARRVARLAPARALGSWE